MLQRIQSLLLLLAMVANLSILFVPFWTFSSGEKSESLTALNITAGEAEAMTAFDHTDMTQLLSHAGVLGFSLVSGILLLITIFLYNNRKRQKNLAYLCIILSMMLLLSMVLLSQQGPSLIEASQSTAAPGFFMPVATILLIWVAINRIQKDEDLVNSLNRDSIR